MRINKLFQNHGYLWYVCFVCLLHLFTTHFRDKLNVFLLKFVYLFVYSRRMSSRAIASNGSVVQSITFLAHFERTNFKTHWFVKYIHAKKQLKYINSYSCLLFSYTCVGQGITNRRNQDKWRRNYHAISIESSLPFSFFARHDAWSTTSSTSAACSKCCFKNVVSL